MMKWKSPESEKGVANGRRGQGKKPDYKEDG